MVIIPIANHPLIKAFNADSGALLLKDEDKIPFDAERDESGRPLIFGILWNGSDAQRAVYEERKKAVEGQLESSNITVKKMPFPYSAVFLDNTADMPQALAALRCDEKTVENAHHKLAAFAKTIA